MSWEQNQRISFVEALFSGMIFEELIFPFPEIYLSDCIIAYKKDKKGLEWRKVVADLFKHERSVGEIITLTEAMTYQLEQPYSAQFNDQIALIDLIRHSGSTALKERFFKYRSVPGGGIYIDLFSYREKRGVLEFFNEDGVDRMSGVITAKNRSGFGVFLGISETGSVIPCCIELNKIKRKKDQLIFDQLEIKTENRLNNHQEHQVINRYLSMSTLLEATAILGRVKGVLDYIFTHGEKHLRRRSKVNRLMEQVYQLETLCYMGGTLLDYQSPRTFFDTFAIKSTALNCWNSFLKVMVHSGNQYLISLLPRLVEEVSFEGEDLERITLTQIALDERKDQEYDLSWEGALKSPFKLFSTVSRLFVQQISASAIESGFKRISPLFHQEGERITDLLKQLHLYINRKDLKFNDDQRDLILTFIADITIRLYGCAVLLSRGSSAVVAKGESKVMDEVQLIKVTIQHTLEECKTLFASRKFQESTGSPGYYRLGEKSGGYYFNLIKDE